MEMEQLATGPLGQSARLRRLSSQCDDAIRHGSQVSADLDMRQELIEVLVSDTSEVTLQCFDKDPDNGGYPEALGNSRDVITPR